MHVEIDVDRLGQCSLVEAGVPILEDACLVKESLWWAVSSAEVVLAL